MSGKALGPRFEGTAPRVSTERARTHSTAAPPLALARPLPVRDSGWRRRSSKRRAAAAAVERWSFSAMRKRNPVS